MTNQKPHVCPCICETCEQARQDAVDKAVFIAEKYCKKELEIADERWKVAELKLKQLEDE